MPGSVGFGNVPPGFGPAGVELPRPLNPADALDRLANRLTLPPYSTEIPFDFVSNNQSSGYQNQTVLINSFTITVVTGTVSIWRGVYSQPAGLGIPHYQFGPGQTAQILLPPREWNFTIQSTGGAATGTLIVEAL